MSTLGQNIHIVNGASTAGSLLGAPVADAFQGTAYSDIVLMENWNVCTFLAISGAVAGAANTKTFTVQACSTVAAAATSACTFRYREITAPDTEGAWTAATTAGFLTTVVAANAVFVIEVTADEVNAAGGLGYHWVRLKSVETGTDNVLGGVLIIQSEPRYAGPTSDSTIA